MDPSSRNLIVVVAAAIAGIGIIAAVQRLRKAPEPSGGSASAATAYEVAGYADLTKKIRAGIADGPRTSCDRPPVPGGAAEKREAAADAPSLRALANGDDAALVEAVLTRAGAKERELGSRAVSVAARNVMLLAELDGEVNNGGFHQFFSNSSGNCAVRTLEAVRALGDATALSLYQRALAVFPSPPAEDRATRGAQMERIPNEFDAWNELDGEYYAAHPVSYQVEARYIREHIDELGL